jgi:hypothetical protein
MKATELENWAAFEQTLKELRASQGEHASPLVFRGQGNSEWSLATTLERNGQEAMSFSDFYRLISARVRPAVETFTGANWDVSESSNELAESFADVELFTFHRFPQLPCNGTWSTYAITVSPRRCSTGRTLPTSRRFSLSGMRSLRLEKDQSTSIVKRRQE